MIALESKILLVSETRGLAQLLTLYLLPLNQPVLYTFPMAPPKKNFARYLPVNEEAIRWEIYCNDAGYTNVPPGSEYPPNPDQHPRSYASKVTTGRILKEFQVVYITSGSGIFHDKSLGTRDLKAGDIFLLFPGVWHSYHPNPETGWQEYWVGFAGDHAQRLWRNRLFDPTKPIHHLGINREIIADYEHILQLCREQPPAFQIRLGALVLQLLAHIHTAEINARVKQNDSELVSAARILMQVNVDAGIEIEDIAKELKVTYTYLLEIFRQYTGMTPYQYFLQMRMYRAKDLLADPSLSIKEVAAIMKFENQYYFSRLFKKKTGYTPSQWKYDQPEE